MRTHLHNTNSLGHVVILVVFTFLVTAHNVRAANLDPVTFDKNFDGLLDLQELRRYVIKRDNLKPDLKVYMTEDLELKANATELIQESLFEQADFRIGEIYAHLRLPIGSAIPVGRFEESLPHRAESKLPQIPGLLGAKKELPHGTIGPVLLRRTPDGWDKGLKEAKGATLSFANNQLSDKQTWSTEGALIFPIARSEDRTASNPESSLRSHRLFLLPSMGWKVSKIAETDKGDVEELEVRLPVAWSANHVNLGWLRNSQVELSPYAHTDFSVEGLILGVTASYSPYIYEGASGFGINSSYKGLGSSPFLYRLGMVPMLDFNHLSSTSPYIKRKGNEDYFRAGGRAEIGLITKGSPAVEAIGTYQALAGISGAPDYSDLVSVAGKLWLNSYAGFSVEYQRGNTPVAQKALDLWTVGLELKF